MRLLQAVSLFSILVAANADQSSELPELPSGTSPSPGISPGTDEINEPSPSSTSPLDSALYNVTLLDNIARASFAEITSQSFAENTALKVADTVHEYLKLRRFQRPLHLLSFGRDSLPSPFYMFRLAHLEATALSCFKDLNGAILVLHRARDELLGYLGQMNPEKLGNLGEVWETTYAQTSTLIGWYRATGGAIGAEMLVDWMVENGPYRSKFQLPKKYVRELDMNPWPAWKDFDFRGFRSVGRILEDAKGELTEEVQREDVQAQLALSHDVTCVLEIDEEKELDEQFHLRLDVGGGSTTSLEQLGEAVEKVGFKVHRLGYAKLSSRGATMNEFGESNVYLNLVMGLGGDGCLTVTNHYQEVKSVQDRPVVLFDDSFFHNIGNECDGALNYVYLDVYHPQFLAK